MSVSRPATEVTRILIQHRADVNFENDDRETVLHVVARLGDVDHIRMLLGARCDPDISSSLGSTPFDLATRGGMLEAAALLRDAMQSAPRARRWRSGVFTQAFG
jgi:ankyrin repeat protein